MRPARPWRTTRAAGVELIRYVSVRDPEHRLNLALLTCRAFRAQGSPTPAPLERQSWRLRVSAAGVQALRDFPKLSLDFGRDAFAADPRLKDFAWARWPLR